MTMYLTDSAGRSLSFYQPVRLVNVDESTQLWLDNAETPVLLREGEMLQILLHKPLKPNEPNNIESSS